MNPDTRNHVHALVDQLPPCNWPPSKSMLEPLAQRPAKSPPDDELFTVDGRR